MWLIGLVPNRGAAEGIMALVIIAVIISPLIFAFKFLTHLLSVVGSPGMAATAPLLLLALIMFFVVLPIAAFKRKKKLALVALVLPALLVAYITHAETRRDQLFNVYDQAGSINPMHVTEAVDRGQKTVKRFGPQAYSLRTFLPDVRDFFAYWDYDAVCIRTFSHPEFRGAEGFAALNAKRTAAGFSAYTDKQKASCKDAEAIKDNIGFDMPALLASEYADMKAAYKILVDKKLECTSDGHTPCYLLSPYSVQVASDGLPIVNGQDKCLRRDGCKLVIVPSLQLGEEAKLNPHSGLFNENWRRAGADLRNLDSFTNQTCEINGHCSWLLHNGAQFKR